MPVTTILGDRFQLPKWQPSYYQSFECKCKIWRLLFLELHFDSQIGSRILGQFWAGLRILPLG